MDLRPNRTLQHSEKNYKIYLKQLLKEQHVLYKYSMRYQQAVRRKDRSVANTTRQQLTQLQEQIKNRFFDTDMEHSSTVRAIQYTHILNDPFIPKCYTSIEDDDTYSDENDDDSPSDQAAYTTIIKTSTTTATATTTIPTMSSNDTTKGGRACTPPPSKERMFIEGFYQQLLQQLSSSSLSSCSESSSVTTQQQRASATNDCNYTNDNGSGNGKSRNDEDTKEISKGGINRNNNDSFSTSTNHSHETHPNIQTNSHQIPHATTYAVTRELLRNMTKGTQHLDQFDNYYALLGYTRHKFVERAMLVVSSLNQVLQLPLTPSCPSHQCIMDEISAKQWQQRILSIRTMTSIGCGPGCDAVGVVAVLLSAAAAAESASVMLQPQQELLPVEETQEITAHDHAVHGSNRNNAAPSHKFILDRIVLLDWAMEQWHHPIVQCVSNMLTSSSSFLPTLQQRQQYVQSIICETCDVRQSVEQQRGTEKKFFTTQRMNNGDRCHNEDCVTNENDNKWLMNTDLVVISYLLSETRNAWYTYMDDYIRRHCKVGTMFLITDPTAWQLHIFRQRYEFDTSSDMMHRNEYNNGSSADGIPPSKSEVDLRDISVSIQEVEQGHRPQHQVQRRVLMEFQWLDSSMFRPELQELEGRNGPGVLLAMKVANQNNHIDINVRR